MVHVRWRERLRTGVLALAAFVLAHDAIYLILFGPAYRFGMARLGHDGRWTAAVLIVAALSVGLGVAGAIRLIQLARLARQLDAGRVHIAPTTTRLGRHVLRSWAAIFPIATLLFVGMENLEHVAAGLPIPGLAVLGSIGYPGTLAVLAVVAAGAALVEALYRWRRDLLTARIAAARARWARSAARPPRPELPWVERRHGSISGHTTIGRAPPLVDAA